MCSLGQTLNNNENITQAKVYKFGLYKHGLAFSIWIVSNWENLHKLWNVCDHHLMLGTTVRLFFTAFKHAI